MDLQIVQIKHTREYIRVPQKKQTQLIRLVFRRLWKINSASAHLGIKYASGKNIISKYKKNILYKVKLLKWKMKRCHYRPFEAKDRQIQVISSSYGNYFRKNQS